MQVIITKSNGIFTPTYIYHEISKYLGILSLKQKSWIYNEYLYGLKLSDDLRL